MFSRVDYEKINHFEVIFSGHLKGDYWFLGC